jgi:hypothetical protein
MSGTQPMSVRVSGVGCCLDKSGNDVLEDVPIMP